MESSKESSIAKHISDLPEEVLIRILENLDGSEVMNATLVCKYFNRTISTSARLMNKIVLKLQKDIRPNNDRAISSLTITRQYKNVSMEDDNYSWLERLRTVEAEKLFTAIATSLENYLTTIKFNKISGFTKIPQQHSNHIKLQIPRDFDHWELLLFDLGWAWSGWLRIAWRLFGKILPWKSAPAIRFQQSQTIAAHQFVTNHPQLHRMQSARQAWTRSTE